MDVIKEEMDDDEKKNWVRISYKKYGRGDI